MTKTELADKALRVLRIFERGQPTSGEYIETVISEYDELYDELALTRRSFWDIDDIPRSAARHVALLLAHRLGRDFGKNTQFRTEIAFEADGQNNHMSAMARLKALSDEQDDPTTDTEDVDF